MKHLNIIILLALAASARASDFAGSAIADNSSFYRERIDRVVSDFLSRGAVPNSDDITRIQTLENHFISTIKLDHSARKRVPTLLLASIKVGDLRNVPGQFVVERAKGAGLDLRADRLKGRSFRQLPAFSE
ncbi:MAG: hypothetical protein ACOCVM_09630 [Desulfovibrionaceae bacterium]